MTDEIRKLEQACGPIFYLMNAVDAARVQPAARDYYGKRKALLTAIATLIAERDAAVAEAAAFRALEVQPERWHPIIKFSSAFCLVESTYPTREEAMSLTHAIDAWKEPGEQA